MNNPINNDNNWVVLKFGGTSVAKAEHWQTIAEIVAARINEGFRPLVVHSALSGVSNALSALVAKATEATTGNEAFDVDVDGDVEALKQQHLTLASELGLDGAKLLQPFFDELSVLLADIRSSGSAAPVVEARVLALGELMSTTLGANWLQSHDLFADKTPIHWQDARQLLKSVNQPKKSARSQVLSAVCAHEFEQELSDQLSTLHGVVLTQGFIARSENGDDVLLGRGGSDTSAAYFAAKIGAQKLEIWTDVAGVFSADPRLVRGAKLLKELRYDEMQELASMGASILHPRAIPPVRKNS
ncbi:MAG: aspartate kinase, partial [Sphingomonadales bacterium]|nr:aspartate kinase [Sphingomonadales bacterium]